METRTPRPNQCTFTHEGSQIRCELNTEHVNPGGSIWGTDHRAWDDESNPTMKEASNG